RRNAPRRGANVGTTGRVMIPHAVDSVDRHCSVDILDGAVKRHIFAKLVGVLVQGHIHADALDLSLPFAWDKRWVVDLYRQFVRGNELNSVITGRVDGLEKLEVVFTDARPYAPHARVAF